MTTEILRPENLTDALNYLDDHFGTVTVDTDDEYNCKRYIMSNERRDRTRYEPFSEKEMPF